MFVKKVMYKCYLEFIKGKGNTMCEKINVCYLELAPVIGMYQLLNISGTNQKA